MNIKNGVLYSINQNDIVKGSITIPNNVTHIGGCAFDGCTGLTSVQFPESLTHIGDCAFRGCTGLTTVQFPESLTHIGGWAFDGCTGLTSVQFPESLTHIGDCAFRGCTGLTSVQFPESLTHIGDCAFRGCTGLTSVQFPESLTHIGGCAFDGCTGLTSVQFPESLTHIGGCAFDGCTGLTEMRFKKFNRIDKYKTICADGYVMFIQQQRHYDAATEIYKGQLFRGMQDKKMRTTDCYVVECGGNYAHGETLKQAMRDLGFKLASERGASQYEGIDITVPIKFEDCVTMYRIITGACSFGTEQFIDGLDEVKEEYTVQEIIELTHSQYGGRQFAEFFSAEGN